MTAAAMEASAAEAARMEAACMHSATEASLSARGIRTNHTTMIEATERTGVDARCSVVSKSGVSGVAATKIGMAQVSGTKSAVSYIGMIEGSVIRMPESCVPRVGVLEGGTVGKVGVMVKPYRAPMPIGVPVVPTPAKAREEPDANPYTEIDSGGVANDPRPTGVERDWRTVDNPGIIFRHVHDIGLAGSITIVCPSSVTDSCGVLSKYPAC